MLSLLNAWSVSTFSLKLGDLLKSKDSIAVIAAPEPHKADSGD